MLLFHNLTFADNILKCQCNLKTGQFIQALDMLLLSVRQGKGGKGSFEVCLNPRNKWCNHHT